MRARLGIGLELAAELEAVHLRHVGVGEDEIGPRRARLVERIATVDRGRDDEAGLPERHLEHAQTARVAVDEQRLRLPTARYPPYLARPDCHVPPCRVSRALVGAIFYK